jgi:anthranilate synthase component 1
VFDSDPYDEYVETINKLKANMQCISSAEELHINLQNDSLNGSPEEKGSSVATKKAHVDVAAR